MAKRSMLPLIMPVMVTREEKIKYRRKALEECKKQKDQLLGSTTLVDKRLSQPEKKNLRKIVNNIKNGVACGNDIDEDLFYSVVKNDVSSLYESSTENGNIYVFSLKMLYAIQFVVKRLGIEVDYQFEYLKIGDGTLLNYKEKDYLDLLELSMAVIKKKKVKKTNNSRRKIDYDKIREYNKIRRRNKND